MANKERGEMSFVAGDVTYTLAFSIDAICHMEEATGKGVIALTREFADPSKISVSVARAALWAGLRENHPGITLQQAGELIPAAGGLAVIMEHVAAAITAAFPRPDGKSRPRKAAGSGRHS